MKYKTSTSSEPGPHGKHLLRLNRGRTDKTPTSSEPGPHGQTISSCEPGPHGKLLYPSQGLVQQTDENHQIFDPRKIPRGRSQKRIIN